MLPSVHGIDGDNGSICERLMDLIEQETRMSGEELLPTWAKRTVGVYACMARMCDAMPWCLIKQYLHRHMHPSDATASPQNHVLWVEMFA